MRDAVPGDSSLLDRLRAQGVRGKHPLRFFTPELEPVSLHNWYRGRSLFLICGGPSLARLDLRRLDAPGVMTMAINNAWAVYRPDLWVACDQAGRFIDTHWKDPRITKFFPLSRRSDRLRYKRSDGTLAKSAFRVHQMPGVLLFPRNETFDPDRWFKLDAVCWGQGTKPDRFGHASHRSSMIAALHIATHLGFRKIYIVGSDFGMKTTAGYAWNQKRTPGAASYNNTLYKVLNDRFAGLRPVLEAAGIEILNATAGGNLTAFDRIDYHEAVDRARAECATPTSPEGWYDPDPKPKPESKPQEAKP